MKVIRNKKTGQVYVQGLGEVPPEEKWVQRRAFETVFGLIKVTDWGLWLWTSGWYNELNNAYSRASQVYRILKNLFWSLDKEALEQLRIDLDLAESESLRLLGRLIEFHHVKHWDKDINRFIFFFNLQKNFPNILHHQEVLLRSGFTPRTVKDYIELPYIIMEFPAEEYGPQGDLISMPFFLFFSLILLINGFFTILCSRKFMMKILLGIELCLLGLGSSFLFFSFYIKESVGHCFVLSILALAAVESVLGLGIFLLIYRRSKNLDLNNISSLRG